MQASLLERIGAYFIDILIISILVSIVTYTIPHQDSSLNEELETLAEKATNGELTRDEYMKEYQNLLYKSQLEMTEDNTFSLLITVAYLVIFQYLNKGKTIGKKLIGIKIIDKKGNNPDIIKKIIRSLFPFGIMSTSINLIMLKIATKSQFLSTYYILGTIETLFIMVSLFLIYNKKIALHDLIARTNVVKEERR